MKKHLVWTEEEEKQLIKYRKMGLSQRETALRLSQEFNTKITKDAVKHREIKLQNKNKWTVDEKINYKESVEIQADGTHKSDKLLQMSAEQSKDVNFLLEAHGYDKKAWELTSAKNNIWNVYSKQDGIQTLYSSKITVKPRVDQLDLDKLIESFKGIKPYEIETNITDYDNRLLEISLFDAHFGVSDYEYYKPTQEKILNLITLRNWEEILFTVGQDMIHNNDFKGNTANGTSIEVVDMNKAWEDCSLFYVPLITAAKKHSKRVKVIYSKGNHDESISWAFVKYLNAMFPGIEFDDEIEERKIHLFGYNFIGLTHGDKGSNKELHTVFINEFPIEWANAKNREIHKGHYHIEDSKDKYGTMVRTLSTRNKTDKWHKDNAYVGGHKRFMLFEYSKESLESIHYV